MNIQPIHFSAYDKSVLTESHILLINGLIRAYYPHDTFNIYIVPFDQKMHPDKFQLEIIGQSADDWFKDVPVSVIYKNDMWYKDSQYAHMLESLTELITIFDIDGNDEMYTCIEFTPRPL